MASYLCTIFAVNKGSLGSASVEVPSMVPCIRKPLVYLAGSLKGRALILVLVDEDPYRWYLELYSDSSLLLCLSLCNVSYRNINLDKYSSLIHDQ